jgi:hypothetical protein
VTDFGHIARTMGKRAIRLDHWGAGPFLIEVGGRAWRFEDSDQFGPVVLTTKDEMAEVQPGERSPFWRAHDLWRKQGRRMHGNSNRCLWEDGQ